MLVSALFFKLLGSFVVDVALADGRDFESAHSLAHAIFKRTVAFHRALFRVTSPFDIALP